MSLASCVSALRFLGSWDERKFNSLDWNLGLGHIETDKRVRFLKNKANLSKAKYEGLTPPPASAQI